MLVILFILVFEYTYFCFKSVFEYLPHLLPWLYFHIYIICSLHYVTSTCILARTGAYLFLTLIYTPIPSPSSFIRRYWGEVSVLMLTIVQLDITLDRFFFFFVYTSACNLVSATLMCGCSKG